MNEGREKVSAVLRILALLLLPSLVGLAAFRLALAVVPEERLLLAHAADVLPLHPLPGYWMGARETLVHLEPRGKSGWPARGADVRAMVHGDEVSLLIEWPDQTNDSASDAVALQFPLTAQAGEDLPPVLLGDPSHPVRLWIWNPERGASELVVGGPASFQASKPVASGRVLGFGLYMDGLWGVCLRGRMDAPLSDDRPLPFAVYVWDGGSGDQGLTTNVSAWQRMEEEPSTRAALARGVSAGLGVLLLEWIVLGWLRRPGAPSARSA